MDGGARAPDDASRADEVEIPVCPRCFRENDPAASECGHCGAPFSGIGLTLPLESARAEGSGLGSLASIRRPSRLLLVGAWLCLAPLAVMSAGEVIDGLRGRDVPSVRWITFGLGLAFAALFGYVLVRVTQNYVRARRAPAAADDGGSDDEGAAGPPPGSPEAP